MRAGKLNTRIYIERMATTQDSSGQPLEFWSVVCPAWAWIRGSTGIGTIRQIGEADGIPISAAYYSVRVRPRNDLTVGMRVRIKKSGRVMRIKNMARDEERGEWVDLVCEETDGKS